MKSMETMDTLKIQPHEEYIKEQKNFFEPMLGVLEKELDIKPRHFMDELEQPEGLPGVKVIPMNFWPRYQRKKVPIFTSVEMVNIYARMMQIEGQIIIKKSRFFRTEPKLCHEWA